MRTRAIHGLILPALLLVSGCAAGPAADPPPAAAEAPRPRVDGDARMAAGDYDAALLAYERELRNEPSSPILREKALNARRLAARVHAEAAMRAAEAGDEGRAAAELDRARALSPESAVVRRAVDELSGRLANAVETRELVARARAQLAADPEAAEELLAVARTRDPGDLEIVRLQREATLRSLARRSGRGAVEAWEAGDRDRAVRELDGARYGGRTEEVAEVLRARIARELSAEASDPRSSLETVRSAWRTAMAARFDAALVRELRGALVERLLERASQLRAAGRPALAALFEVEARSTGADVPTPALDGLREDVAVTVVVRPFGDETGGLVDGARLARALAARLASDAQGGGLALRVVDAGSDPAAAAAYPRALVLDGTVESQRLVEGRVGREIEQVRYVAGTRRERNPRTQEILSAIDAVGARLAPAQDRLSDAAARLRKLEELPFVPGAGRARTGDVLYQTRLASARSAVEEARREVDRLSAEDFALRQELQATPAEAEVPVYETRPREVTTRIKTAQVTARLRLADGSRVLLDAPVSAAAEHRETIASGLPEASVPADPDQTPDDARMAAAAADRFAALAAGTVRTAASEGARRFLEDARAAERAGDVPAAAEAYALFLLVTPETATPERADAARALEELTDVEVALRTGAGRDGT